MDEQFIKGRILHIRELATKADPFIKRRLVALADKYERALPLTSRPLTRPSAEAPQERT
jgi:hypothetical protein